MEEDWTGKAVSIQCDEKLGVFQGIIKDISATQITIVRAFRNGVPLRKQDAEVTLRCTDILGIRMIPSYSGQSTVTSSVINKPTPVKQPNFANAGTSAGGGGGGGGFGGGGSAPGDNYATSALSNKILNMKISAGGPPNGISSPSSSRASSAQQAATVIGSINGGSNKSSPPNSSTSSSVAQFFGNLIPPKVEVRMGAALTGNAAECYGGSGGGGGAISKPIDIVNARESGVGPFYGQSSSSTAASYTNSNGYGNGKIRNGGGGNGGGGGVGGGGSENPLNSNAKGGGVIGGGNGVGVGASKKQRKPQNSTKQNLTFGTSVDDPLLHEDFDFEGNLALFDKRAIWNNIEANQRPDLLQQTRPGSKKNKKYRHDENILVSEPTQLRQIETMFDGSNDFVTDEGLIIPTIPTFVRSKIELTAEKSGLSLLRQIDILARGATDLAILLLGGARRLTPNNCHQWPKVAIICEKSDNLRSSNIGAATGRQLASLGLNVWLFIEDTNAAIEQMSTEIALFKATGNAVVYGAVNALPTPDLVIVSTNAVNLSSDVKKWLSENRASILAVDPPPCGIRDVAVKYAILPILPLNGISSNNCGKLYLCNLGIPDKFYRDAGIKYKSPFGHKFVIPIHSKD